MKLRDLILLSLLGGLMFALQVAFAFLPNISPVALLVILYTRLFGWKVLYIIYLFAVLEGSVYGFGSWWVAYLYVWTLLAGITWLFRRQNAPLFWAVTSGLFGLSFGALCALPYLFVGGPAMLFTYWISGIPFDLLHCGGNFAIALVLFKPLDRVLQSFYRRVYR